MCRKLFRDINGTNYRVRAVGEERRGDKLVSMLCSSCRRSVGSSEGKHGV